MVAIEHGDVLCYSGHGLFSTLIRWKTWAPRPLGISHVELANSGATAFASRDGRGVQTYPVDMDPKRFVAILRPVFALDMTAVRKFHAECIGQAYDWKGLLRFFTWGKQSQDKQFCSEYVMRLLRHGGLEPFTPETDADLVAPCQFMMSPTLTCMWRKDSGGVVDPMGAAPPCPGGGAGTTPPEAK